MIHRSLSPGQGLIGSQVADDSRRRSGSGQGRHGGQRGEPRLEPRRFGQRGQVGQRCGQRQIMDGPRRLERQQWIRVAQESPDRRGFLDPGRQEYQLSDFPIGVGAMGFDHPIRQRGRQSVGQPMSEHDVGFFETAHTADEGVGIAFSKTSPTEGQSGGQTHAGIGLGQLLLQPLRNAGLPHDFRGRSQRPYGLDAQGSFCSLGQAEQQIPECRRILASQLPHRTNGMDASPLVGCRGRQGLQRRHRSGPPSHPFELSLLADSLIPVAKQPGQLFRGACLHAVAQQSLSEGHLGIGGHLGESGLVDPPLVALRPAFVPIGEEDGSVGPQIDIGHE